MKYKLEIIADTLPELMSFAVSTTTSVSSDEEFMDKIESKTIESSFFTKHATITTLKDGGE